MTSKGTIAVEEAVISPATAWFLDEYQQILTPGDAGKQAVEAHKHRLLDIHGARLQAMDAEGVEYMLLSLTSPGCQGIPDQKLAEKSATEFNDWLAAEVTKNSTRFGGLAALSMHDPSQAAAELERTVTELNFFGGLVNDFQTMGDGSGKQYYDTPFYDPFWKKVQELDVPIYFHPRYPPAKDLEGHDPKYGGRRHLLGAGVQFHLDLSFHIYSMCSSAVFDRFPRLKIVVGHLGENIPFNLWRASHWYNKPSKKVARPTQHDYKYYFQHNIFITTSGNFTTAGLKFCIEELGVERCLFSIGELQFLSLLAHIPTDFLVDTPYDQIEEAQAWWRTVDLDHDTKEQVARRNTIKLFKLPLEI